MDRTGWSFTTVYVHSPLALPTGRCNRRVVFFFPPLGEFFFLRLGGSFQIRKAFAKAQSPPPFAVPPTRIRAQLRSLSFFAAFARLAELMFLFPRARPHAVTRALPRYV